MKIQRQIDEETSSESESEMDTDTTASPVRGRLRVRGRGRGNGTGRGRGRARERGKSARGRGRGRRRETSSASVLPSMGKIYCAHYLYTITIINILTVWSSSQTPVATTQFSQPVGPTQPLSNDPSELFRLFFTDEIVGQIVCETNRYAAQCLEGKGTTWTTNEAEIRAYFGFYIYMGLVKEPEIRDYWSNDDTFHYAPIAGRISRLRFEEVSRYLHFVDSSQLPAHGTPGYHRLQRVKPIIDALCSRCSTLYHPRANLSVDEAMVPFKGLKYVNKCIQH